MVAILRIDCPTVVTHARGSLLEQFTARECNQSTVVVECEQK